MLPSRGDQADLVVLAVVERELVEAEVVEVVREEGSEMDLLVVDMDEVEVVREAVVVAVAVEDLEELQEEFQEECVVAAVVVVVVEDRVLHLHFNNKQQLTSCLMVYSYLVLKEWMDPHWNVSCCHFLPQIELIL